MEFDNLTLYKLMKLSYEKMQELRTGAVAGKHLDLEYLHWNAIYTKSYILKVNRGIAKMKERRGEQGPTYIDGWQEEILEHIGALGLDLTF